MQTVCVTIYQSVQFSQQIQKYSEETISFLQQQRFFFFTQMVKSIRNVVIKLLSGLSHFLRKQKNKRCTNILTVLTAFSNKIRYHLSVGVANIYLVQHIMFSLPAVQKQWDEELVHF